jgi:hypothetical protein
MTALASMSANLLPFQKKSIETINFNIFKNTYAIPRSQSEGHERVGYYFMLVFFRKSFRIELFRLRKVFGVVMKGVYRYGETLADLNLQRLIFIMQFCLQT